MKKGVALLLAISAVFVLLFIGIILIILAKRETGLTLSLKQRHEAFSYAEAGIDRAYNAFYGFPQHSPDVSDYRIDFERGWFTREGYNMRVEYLRKGVPPGYQRAPKHLAGANFDGFYYHIPSSGFKGNVRRTIHITLERIFPVE